MLTTVRHIFGRIMHSETALHGQWDKGRKNNLLFASSSIRRPTISDMVDIRESRAFCWIMTVQLNDCPS